MNARFKLICGMACGLLLMACGGGGNGTSGSTGGGGSSGSTGTTGNTSGTSDPTVIATGLTQPIDLAITSDTIYFTSEPQQPGSGAPVPGSVEKVASSGGTPTTVIASSLNPTAIAADANNLYWFQDDGTNNDTFALMKSGLDGSSPAALATGLSPDQDTRLVVMNGKLYWGDDNTGLSTLSTSGGTPSTLVPQLANVGGTGIGGGPLLAVNANGFTWYEIFNGTTIRHAALDGSGATSVVTVPASDLTQVLELLAIGDDGTNTYWVTVNQTGQDEVSSLFKAPNAGGTATKVLDYTGDIDDLAVDANGIYFHDDVAATEGIYSVSGGTATLAHKDAQGAANERELRLDSSNLYWVAGGFNAGQAILHKMAR